VAVSCPAPVEVPVRLALKALCTTAVGTGDIVGTVEIALCCGARALRIRAIPGDLTDIARTTSTLGATLAIGVVDRFARCVLANVAQKFGGLIQTQFAQLYAQV